MPCSWEGNRSRGGSRGVTRVTSRPPPLDPPMSRPGVALEMRHRLQWFIHLYGLTVQGREMSTSLTLLVGYGILYLYLQRT